MNNKVYRLLRNNKEQGPFTSEELVIKGLKPYDLVWIDGRSAAWSYPGEMAEFKNYVPSPDDYRTNLIITKQERISRVSNTVQAAVVMNDNLIQPAIIKQKPRYKVSAAWSKIQTITTQTPAYVNTVVAEPKKISSLKIVDIKHAHIANAKALNWEDAWLDWEHEKSTVAPAKVEAILAIPPVHIRAINETENKAPVLEKKFEQSLDTITDNYIDNLLQQKKKTKQFSFGKSSEFILPSIALVVIFSIGYWLMHNTKTAVATIATANQQTIVPDKKEQQSLNISPVNKNASVQIPAEQTQKNVAPLNEPVAKEKTISYANNVKFNAPEKINTAADNVATNKNIQTNSSNASDVDLKKNNTSANKQFDPSVINNIPADNSYKDASTVNNGDLNAAENRPVRRRTNNPEITANQSVNQPASDNVSTTKNIKEKSAISYVNVPEYVTMDNGNGSLKIANISDDNLDLVVVDVQYYDASGRYRKGETMYLHNLKAGKTVTIKTPRDINSSYATSKVSLVSSDANNVYAVGDN